MSNAVKYLILAAVIIAFSSCIETVENKADSLLKEAKAAYDNHDCQLAMTLIDSLESAFPEAIEQRREALSLRIDAEAELMIRQKELNDSLIVDSQIKLDSLVKFFDKINYSGLLTPYFVCKPLAGRPILSRTGIEPRVTDEGNMTLISSLIGHKIGHVSLTLSDANGSCSATSRVEYDGERNLHDGTSEIITFIDEEFRPITEFAKLHRQNKLTLRFDGKSSYSMPLSEGELKALIQSAELADAAHELVRLRNDSIYIERKLQIARDQKARKATETTKEE